MQNYRPASLLVAALMLASGAVDACGEGMFNTGKGLPYQAYLAPRPAAVLVYDDAATGAAAENQQALYAGLQQAGHTVTVVRDRATLEQAMAGKRYDVVISDLASVAAVAALNGSASHPRVLPVVSRSDSNSPHVRERYDLFVLDGASLGQYLRVINKAVQGLAK